MGSEWTIAFDYDGTLTSGNRTGAEADFRPLAEAIRRGYSVAVMTCNDIFHVSAVLNRSGITTQTDPAMRIWLWENAGSVVLVTNRKVWAAIYPDDRGFQWQHGDDPEAIFAEAAKRREARHACTARAS